MQSLKSSGDVRFVPDVSKANSVTFIENIPYESIKFIKHLGDGSFSSVYEGWERIEIVKPREWDGKRVAVKILKKGNEYVKQCTKREIDIQRNLNHPNCLKIYGLSHNEKGDICLVIPYAENVLQDAIMNHRIKQVMAVLMTVRYSFTEKKQLLIEIATAIAYLHSLGIIHRDIKALSLPFRNA